MISLAAFLVLGRISLQDPPRLRTILDNGAVVLVEPRACKSISLQLFASSKHVIESEATHGYRHLLEHLLSRGPNREIDRTLESQGCYLTASTARDALQIEIHLGKDQFDVGLAALAKLLRRPSFTQEQIDREVRVIRDEIAMQDSPSRLSSASWLAAYGEAGLDPMGTFDSLYRATPEKLLEIYGQTFASDGLAVAVCGPVDLDGATKKLAALLAPRARYAGKAEATRGEGIGGYARAESDGESRAALVPAFNNPITMGTLAAALAIASNLPDSFVIYTPSAKNGLVVVGRKSLSSGVATFIDSYPDPGDLFATGRALARQWVNRQLETESGTAHLRGLLLCQGSSLRPEMMLEAINSMTPQDFTKGFSRLRGSQAVTVVGTR